MAINYNTIAKELFSQLIGQGNEVDIFDASGKKVWDAEDARSMYSKNNQFLVIIDQDSAKIKVKFGPSTDKETISKFIEVLKNKENGIAKKYILGVDVMPYSNKDIELKDAVVESLSSAHGSVKTSYQQTEGAKLIIRHHNPVNEEIRGSRSRNIKALFIENSQGERFKYPHNHLLAARTMTQHVAEGGTPYDEIGTKIVSLSEERAQLMKVASYIKTNGLQEQAGDIGSVVSTRLSEIKSLLSRYNPTALSADVYESSEEDLDTLKEKLTKNVFDEAIEDMLPKLNGYMTAYAQRQQAAEDVESLKTQIEESEIIAVSELPEIAEFDMIVYESPTVGTTQLINVILPVIENETLKQSLSAVAKHVKTGMVETAVVENLARAVVAKMAKPQSALPKSEFVLENAFSKFTVREILK